MSPAPRLSSWRLIASTSTASTSAACRSTAAGRCSSGRWPAPVWCSLLVGCRITGWRLGAGEATRLRRHGREGCRVGLSGRPDASVDQGEDPPRARFVLGGIVGLPYTFAGILVGQRIGRRLLYRGTVEWGLGMRTAQDLLRRGRERSTTPFDNFRLSRGVTWARSDPARRAHVQRGPVARSRVSRRR